MLPTLRLIVIAACKSFMPFGMKSMADQITTPQINQFLAALDKQGVFLAYVDPAGAIRQLQSGDDVVDKTIES